MSDVKLDGHDCSSTYGWLHIRVDILNNPGQDLGVGLAVLFFLPLTCFYYHYYLYYLLFVQLKPFQAFFLPIPRTIRNVLLLYQYMM